MEFSEPFQGRSGQTRDFHDRLYVWVIIVRSISITQLVKSLKDRKKLAPFEWTS